MLPLSLTACVRPPFLPPQIVLDWLGQLLRLPSAFLSPQGGTGVIQSTASEATLVALLSAKARTMQGRPEEDALKLCAYCSDQAHSSGERGYGWKGERLQPRAQGEGRRQRVRKYTGAAWCTRRRGWLPKPAALAAWCGGRPHVRTGPAQPTPPHTCTTIDNTKPSCAPCFVLQCARRAWWRASAACEFCPPRRSSCTRCRWAEPLLGLNPEQQALAGVLSCRERGGCKLG